MKTVEQILYFARRSTNTSQIPSLSDFLLVDYLNRVQSILQDHLFLVNDENDLFIKDYDFDLLPGVDEYVLPLDIYAKSSIDNVAVSFLNGLSNTYLPLKKVSRKQRGFTFGYFTQENLLIFTPRPTSTLAIKLSYQRKVPDLSIVCGTVSNISGNTLTLTGYVSGFTEESSYVSVSDLVSGMKIVSYVDGTSITLDTVSGINIGDNILSGQYATNISELPPECEKYLITALERMIQYRQSSTDFQVTQLITKEELDVLREVFADNSYDDAKPPVTEWTEWLP